VVPKKKFPKYFKQLPLGKFNPQIVDVQLRGINVVKKRGKWFK
jgi:hypothetical protein